MPLQKFILAVICKEDQIQRLSINTQNIKDRQTLALQFHVTVVQPKHFHLARIAGLLLNMPKSRLNSNFSHNTITHTVALSLTITQAFLAMSWREIP